MFCFERAAMAQNTSEYHWVLMPFCIHDPNAALVKKKKADEGIAWEQGHVGI